jgi:hypothetical protein
MSKCRHPLDEGSPGIVRRTLYTTSISMHHSALAGRLEPAFGLDLTTLADFSEGLSIF